MTTKTALHNPTAFFAAIRQTAFLGPTLSADEVLGLNEDLEACGALGFSPAWTAYCIATDYHETAGTMRPIKEYGRGAGHAYGKPTTHGGQIAYGRGKVQLTWDYNYEKADAELAAAGLIKPGELLANYDLALRPDLASFIMAEGMANGWFTNRKLGDYLTAPLGDRPHFISSRRIINGTDRADKIAGYAIEIQAALVKGDWR